MRCTQCNQSAKKVVSAGAFFLYGSPEGWEKPSKTAKRVVNPDSITYSSDKKGDWVK